MTRNTIKSLVVVMLTAVFVVAATPVYAQKAKKQKAKKEKITDPRLLTVSKMAKMTKESQFVTKGVTLKTKHRATQGFAVADDNQTLYFSQPGNIAKYQQGVTKVHEDGKDYIWIGSNATKYNKSYSRTRTVSRFPFEPGKEINEGYAGETYYLGGERYCYPAVNAAADVLGVVTMKAGAVTVNLYHLSEARALDNTDVKLTTVYKGELVGEEEQTVKRTIKAKDLTTLDPISSFTVPKPDKETGDPVKDVNYYTFRAWDVDKDYVYFVEGQHNSGNMSKGESKAFITVYDHSGRVVMPKRRIQCVFDHYLLESLEITPAGYADIAGIKVIDSSIYVMFSVKNSKGFKTVVVKYE